MSWNGTASTAGVEVIQGINQLTNYYFGVFILVLVWGIIYYASRGEPTRESVVAASVTTLIVAVILWTIDIVQAAHLAITFVLAVGSLVLLINRS